MGGSLLANWIITSPYLCGMLSARNPWEDAYTIRFYLVLFKPNLSPDGENLASVGADNRICIFRFSNPILITVAGQPELSEIPTLWCHVPMAHTEDINSVCWSPKSTKLSDSQPPDENSGKLLCSAGDDGVIRFWVVPSCYPVNCSELAVD
ncbi:hypothetical protein FBUS_03750 [Fasciolopsis buskii]|uniref:Uncharacterized protein n=1 Tax=Fasciolopsis buskii TaxID=27845 RepID=A0A8E0S1L7_9TREM|nr:hypothetical protein FBUS_03750 [Fasciolopsis buski]